jgi:hypothetical protein
MGDSESLFRQAGKHLRILPRISHHRTIFLPLGTLLSLRVTPDELTGSAYTIYKTDTPTDYTCGNTPMGVIRFADRILYGRILPLHSTEDIMNAPSYFFSAKLKSLLLSSKMYLAEGLRFTGNIFEATFLTFQR